jgi:hypothetical protein
MKGLRISIYRNAEFGDCTNGGVSAMANSAIVIGPGIPEIFEASDRDVVLELKKGNIPGAVKLVPLDAGRGWTMFGGNFGFTSDSRFSQAVCALAGADCYGAVPIHDRIES